MSQEYKESGETRKEEGNERARNIRKVERGKGMSQKYKESGQTRKEEGKE